MVIEIGQAQAAVAAAWQLRERLPASLREAIEVTLLRAAGALMGQVPPLRVAHLYPRPAEQRPEPGQATSEAEQSWEIAMNAVAVALRHLLDAEIPEERATLQWLGLMSVSADDALEVVARASAILGGPPMLPDEMTLPDLGELEDPYDDPHLALVPYLRDQARLEAQDLEVGPAEAAMMLGPEPLVGSREALGLSFLRWRSSAAGLSALVRCRLHGMSHQDWVVVVPASMRGRRSRVRAFLNALRVTVQSAPSLHPLRHVRPPRPEALARLLDRIFVPSALEESGEDAVDFEEVLVQSRYLGGIAAELEASWPASPFRRVEREAGSVRRAMELLAPTILEVAQQHFEGVLTITFDDYEECFEIGRVRRVVEEVLDPLREVALEDAPGSSVGDSVCSVLERVRTESWQP